MIGVAKEGPGRHVDHDAADRRRHAARSCIASRPSTTFRDWACRPTGKSFAFAAPAPDGFYQIFRKAIDGDAAPVQVTSDPSNKTQPAWSPDGQRVAFTVWSYDATFWSFTRR